MAINRNLDFFRGEDVTISVSMSPVTDITGWTLDMTARSAADAASTAIYKSTGTAGGITITNATAGLFTVTINDADSTALTPSTFSYDIKRMDNNAEAILVQGKLILKQETTR